MTEEQRAKLEEARRASRTSDPGSPPRTLRRHPRPEEPPRGGPAARVAEGLPVAGADVPWRAADRWRRSENGVGDRRHRSRDEAMIEVSRTLQEQRSRPVLLGSRHNRHVPGRSNRDLGGPASRRASPRLRGVDAPGPATDGRFGGVTYGNPEALMLRVPCWIVIIAAHAEDVREPSDLFGPPGWRGNPWGPAACCARGTTGNRQIAAATGPQGSPLDPGSQGHQASAGAD